MSRIKVIAFGVLVVAVIVLAYLLNRSNEEKNRLDDNQTSLLTAIRVYKTSDSLNAASVQALTLDNQEFKRFNAGLVKTVESLNIKVRRLQWASEVGISADYQVKTKVRDSLVYIDNSRPPDTIQCIDHKDEWMQIAGCIKNKEFNGVIHSTDSIDQFAHRVPRKFWFIKYGTKGVRMDVVSKNPNSTIYYLKYIELKK